MSLQGRLVVDGTFSRTGVILSQESLKFPYTPERDNKYVKLHVLWVRKSVKCSIDSYDISLEAYKRGDSILNRWLKEA